MTIVPGRWLPGQATSRRAVGELGPPNRRSKKVAGSPPRDATVCAWAEPVNATLHATNTTANTKWIMRTSLAWNGTASTPDIGPSFRRKSGVPQLGTNCLMAIAMNLYLLISLELVGSQESESGTRRKQCF